jgi:hypothetical protein
MRATPICHIGVAGKIEVELQRVAQNRRPCPKKLEGLRVSEAGVRRRRQWVCDQHFFRQSDRENREAHRHILHAEPVRPRLRELRHDLAVVENGAGDEVWKERHKQEIVDNAALLGHALLTVDEISDLCEGEERDTQRQHHFCCEMRNDKPAGMQ